MNGTRHPGSRGIVVAVGAAAAILLVVGLIGAVDPMPPPILAMGLGVVAVAAAALAQRRDLLWTVALAVLAAENLSLVDASGWAHPWLHRALAALATLATTAVADAWIANGRMLRAGQATLVTRTFEAARQARLLAEASHDIRTPVNAIRLQVALIAHSAARPATAGRVPELAAQLEKSVLALLATVADVLDPPRVAARTVEVVPAPDGPNRSTPLTGVRVVLAEDHDMTRTACSELLRAEGATVTEAADGVEALRMIDAEQPQVVLLDLMMPRLDGLGVLRRLQLSRPPPLETIVVVSGDRRAESLAEMRELGADAVIAKPIDPSHLVRLLQDVTARAHAPR